MADIPYNGDINDPNFFINIRTYRKALTFYHADAFDECASVLHDIIKTDPPIFWKCTFLTMLCIVTEHWFRAERYRLHAEALWKLLDDNREIHKATNSVMNGLRGELNDAYRWCCEGRPDDPEADAEGVAEYWEEWGGKDPNVDFDTSAVGTDPASTMSGASENASGASMATQAGSDRTITDTYQNTGEGGTTDVLDKLLSQDPPPSKRGHVRSNSDPAPTNGVWRSIPFSQSDNKRSLDHDGAEEAETKRAKQAIPSAEVPKIDVATEGPSLNKKLPPLPADDGEEAGPKPKSAQDRWLLKQFEPLEDNVPLPPIARALSPTKSTAARSSITSTAHASTHSLVTPRPGRLHFGNASTASLATLNTPTTKRATARGKQAMATPTAAEVFSNATNAETPTTSGTTALPIRAAGETAHQRVTGGNTVKGKKKEQDTRKVKLETRDPFTPKS
jgi:hypothetical protein